MLGHDGAVALCIVAPDLFVDALLVVDLPGIHGEELDDLILFFCQPDLLPAGGDRLCVKIHSQCAAGQQMPCPELPVVAADMRLDPGPELCKRKGLDDIIIAARRKACDLVRILDAGGQEQDRAAHLTADPAADREAVHLRHIDVEQRRAVEKAVHMVVHGENMIVARRARVINAVAEPMGTVVHRNGHVFQLVVLPVVVPQILHVVFLLVFVRFAALNKYIVVYKSI